MKESKYRRIEPHTRSASPRAVITANGSSFLDKRLTLNFANYNFDQISYGNLDNNEFFAKWFSLFYLSNVDIKEICATVFHCKVKVQ